MVVFSIDGSFTASVSVTGKDPKVTMAKTIKTLIMTIMTGPPELGGRGAALARPGLPHHLRHRQTVYAAAEGTHHCLLFQLFLLKKSQKENLGRG